MNLKQSKETEKNKVELIFVIDKADFDAAVMRAFHKNAPKITIPGFRKGKAPKGLIEKFYGKDVFYNDAVNDILPDEMENAVKETGFEPADTPTVTNVDFEAQDGIEIAAQFIRKPDVTLGDYKSIAVEKQTVETTDQDVDEELETVRKRYSRMIAVEGRPAQDGDTADIDYEGFCDGAAFDGGKDTGHKLKLGSNTFIPGFEEQIVGKQIGDSFDVNVTFPKEYHAENLAGKDAVFKVKLNGLEYEELPVLDDEFAKDASEFNSLDEYKQDIRAKIEKRHADDADRRLDDDLTEKLCALVQADIPEIMITRETENLVREYDYNLRRQGLSLDMFLQYTGMKLEDIRARYEKAAQTNVKRQLALAEISKLEDIAVTEEDIGNRYHEMAQQFGMQDDELKKRISEDEIRQDLKITKAFDFVKEHATVTETTVTQAQLEEQEKAKAENAQEKGDDKADPKPAKKTASKKEKTPAIDAEQEKTPAKRTRKTVSKEKADDVSEKE